MTAIEDTPTNKNFLSPLNFKFQIKRSPHVNFFIQKVNIPSIEFPKLDVPDMFVPIPTPGSRPNFGNFMIEFKVDEDFQNYFEIYNWIRALSSPINFDEYKAIKQIPEYTGEGLRSDLSLIILNAIKNPNYELIIKDAFPYSLSDINFDTTNPDVQYVSATASFYYIWFDLIKL
jgi:hypothetical protein